VTRSPLVASDIFLNAPEDEETISGGARMVIVRTVDDQGLTPVAWLQANAPQPDARIESVTGGQRAGARGLIGATGETYAMAFAARGWIYGIERTYFGAPDREAEQILATLRILDDATLGRAPSATPVPRSIESLVDALATGFAKKDIAAIADAMALCISAGAVPGDPTLLSRTAYVRSLAVEFAAGRSVQVQSRPIESDPNYGRFVRSTWSKPGEPDQRVDLLLRAQDDRWSLVAILIRAFGN